jgi:hypothetical protein
LQILQVPDHLTIIIHLSTGLATMLHYTTLLTAFFLSHLVQSAPTTPLDANTLLQNGQAAQVLNSEFRNLKLTDACTCESRLSNLPCDHYLLLFT